MTLHSKNKNNYLILIIIVVLLIISPKPLLEHQKDQELEANLINFTDYSINNEFTSRDVPFKSSDLIAHDPIHINGNSELAAFPDKTGSGTVEDPYIIENLSINSFVAMFLVNITNISLIIQNCRLYSTYDYYSDYNSEYTIIELENSQNIKFRDCRINALEHFASYPVRITNCSDISFTQNEMGYYKQTLDIIIDGESSYSYKKITSRVSISLSQRLNFSNNHLLSFTHFLNTSSLFLNSNIIDQFLVESSISPHVIHDNNISNVKMTEAYYWQFSNNLITNLYLFNSNSNSFFDNRVSNLLQMDKGQNNVFINNNFDKSSIILEDSSNNLFQKNNISQNPKSAMMLKNSSYNQIDSNLFQFNNESIIMQNSKGNILKDNRFSQNENYEIILQRTYETLIFNNSITFSSSGIYLEQAEKNKIRQNKIDYCIGSPLFLSESHQNNISKNIICYCEKGITGIQSNNNWIHNNSIEFVNSAGISFYGVSNNFLENWIKRNHNGFQIWGNANLIINNTIKENKENGIYLWGEINTIINNSISNNQEFGLCIEGDRNLIANNSFSDNVKGNILINGDLQDQIAPRILTLNKTIVPGMVKIEWIFVDSAVFYQVEVNQSLVGQTTQNYFNVNLEQVGTHNIEIIAIESDRNLYRSNPIEIIVKDNIPPNFVNFSSKISFREDKNVSFTINATDNVAIDCYWLNDTRIFRIDDTGLISNISTLEVGIYDLEVFVNDTTGNILSQIISITLQSVDLEDNTTADINDEKSGKGDNQSGIPGYSFALLIGVSALMLIVLMKRKQL